MCTHFTVANSEALVNAFTPPFHLNARKLMAHYGRGEGGGGGCKKSRLTGTCI